jgi:glycosyltransferase involved in cell wall biosynthesis
MPPGPTIVSHDWVRRIEESIRDAQAGSSRLVSQVLSVPGMTSPLVKHFLNNLCGGDDVVYLEVGSWQGATVTAASCRNPGRFLAIDKFVQGDGGILHANRQANVEWCRFTFLERDCWDVRPEEVAGGATVNVFFYDGAHDYDSQVRAFVHFHPAFADEFVAVVDDWNHPPVRQGTRAAFAELAYEIVREWELPAEFNGDLRNWWNGLFVALVRQTPRPARKDSPLTTIRQETGGRGAHVQGNGDGHGPALHDERLLPASLRRKPPRTAIVIPCHNYGRFLAEAVESVLAQQAPAAEVVIVDDASTDDTPTVAARYRSAGVRYLGVEHRDVFRTRAAGLAATKAEFVCFLDADDALPRDYLQAGQPLFADRRVAIVFSDAEFFGDRPGRSHFPEWNPAQLERENFIHAGSIVRRAALNQTQAFEQPSPFPSHADWFVWRRLADAGWIGVKQPALYRYRKHGGSMLLTASKASYFERGTLGQGLVTIFTPLAGRTAAWERYRDWLEGQTWPRAQCALVLMDTSGDPQFAAMVRRDLAALDYPDVRYLAARVGDQGLADRPRREHANAVRAACARIYARLARELATPWVMVVEDDVVPPPGIIERLMRAMDKDTALAAAPYRSRYHDAFVCWNDTFQSYPGGVGVAEVGGAGFGCTLIRRAVLMGETFSSSPDESADFDIAFCARLRNQGWKIKADWTQQPIHLGVEPIPVVATAGARRS